MTKIFQSKTRMFINKCTIRFTRRRRTRNTTATTLLIVFCLIFCYFLFCYFLFSILYFLIFEMLRCFPFFPLSFVNLFIGKAFLTHVNNFRCSLDSLKVYLLQILRDVVAAFLGDYVIFHSVCVFVYFQRL